MEDEKRVEYFECATASGLLESSSLSLVKDFRKQE